jgi:hypothetical protein
MAAIAVAAMLLLVRPPGWGHLHTWGASFLQVDLPALPDLDRATVVLAEDEALAFLAPDFPASTSFVRIGGNLLGPPYPVYAMDDEAQRRLAAAAGPLYGLFADPASEHVREVLARQRLAADSTCAPIRSNLLTQTHRAFLCPLTRNAAAPPDLPAARRDE